MPDSKVLIALSGGVDSTVAAHLLQREGFTVEGVFFTFHDIGATANLERVKKIARQLDIKLYLPDHRELFRRTVVQDFLEEYSHGRTPNPCVFCNPELKFKLLSELADEVGASRIATGHYARIRTEGEYYQLYRGKDRAKDQSYFLYRLPQHILARTLFPLGDQSSKSQTYQIAEGIGMHELWVDQPESQDICFVESDLPTMLRQNLPAKCFRPGEIVSTAGEVLGMHRGLVGYTPGQRKGLEIGGNGPWFVVKADFDKNQLIVGRNEDLLAHGVICEKPAWCGAPPADNAECTAQVRYAATPQPGRLSLKTDSFTFDFQKPERAPTPGQSAVLYDGDKCLGGGIIQKALK